MPVVTEEAAVARAAGIGIEIEIAGARVRLSPGVDPALLAVSYKHRKAVAAALKQKHGRRPGDGGNNRRNCSRHRAEDRKRSCPLATGGTGAGAKAWNLAVVASGDLLRRRPPQCGGVPRVRRGQRLLWA